jgi:hypothetical protein
MNQEKRNYLSCFGDLESVFPVALDGLRHTPEPCMLCPDKTICLKAAMEGTDGLKVREETLSRAYESGMIGFLERWSRKKGFWLDKKKKNNKS